jgi:hypothetical protein
VAQRRIATQIATVDDHPNVAEIRGILSRLPCITDGELSGLAEGWHNTTLLSEARRRSLEPSSPLVLDVLGCFETVQSLFADELHGEADYLTVEPDVASDALKAVRDAIAAAYARPILTEPEHEALLRAWRGVYPTDHVVDPDLGGRSSDVAALLLAMPRLAARCHDPRGAAECPDILAAAAAIDEEVHNAARDEAWHAAVLTSRRRVWQLVRQNGLQTITRYCAACRQRRRDEETARVLTLCSDAACGLLVAGTVEDDVVDVLLTPVQCLIPSQRGESTP